MRCLPHPIGLQVASYGGHLDAVTSKDSQAKTGLANGRISQQPRANASILTNTALQISRDQIARAYLSFHLPPTSENVRIQRLGR